MTYQTQQSLAYDTVLRLQEAGADMVCLWIHTGQLESTNKTPTQMNVLAHLLNPLTQNTLCRLFFLPSGDILLIGLPDITDKAKPFTDRLRRVLSHDTFVRQSGDDFMTGYRLPNEAPILLSALDGKSVLLNDAGLYDLYQAVRTYADKQTSPFIKAPVLRLTSILPEHLFDLYLPDLSALGDKYPLTLKRFLAHESCAKYAGLNPIPHSAVQLNIDTVLSSEFDTFIQDKKPIVLLSGTELLLDKNISAALKKIHTLRLKWGVFLPNEALFEILDIHKLKPDFVFLNGKMQNKNTLSAHLACATQIVLTGIDTPEELTLAVQASYTLVSGLCTTLLLGKLCHRACPYNDDCPAHLCGQIYAGKKPKTQCVFLPFLQDFFNRSTQ